MKKIRQHSIEATIKNIGGLRVGGSDDLLQIGAVDLTVIKHPVTFKPYIPGSSLKGKLRSELEKREGKFSGKDGNEPCNCGAEKCLVCRVFGPHKNTRHNLGPTRIIVRDATLLEGGELEIKTENIIDRKTGTALHPRKVERVASGSKWSLRMGIQELDLDQDCAYGSKKGGEALVEFLLDGLRYVQETGLGAGISKGYGEIVIEDLKVNGEPRQL